MNLTAFARERGIFPFRDKNDKTEPTEPILNANHNVNQGCAPARKVIPEGRRNSTLSHFAGRVLKKFGTSDEKAYTLFMDEAAKCEPPLRMDELSVIWNSALGFFKKVQEEPDYIAPEEYASEDFSLKPGDYSDVGQAEVLAREYGDNLRFSESTGFISYNGVFWEECKPKAQGLAQKLTRRQLDEARAAVQRALKKLTELGISDITTKKRAQAQKELTDANLCAFLEWAAAVDYQNYVIKARESKQINSALKEVCPMVLIEVSQLDADPFLLNCPDATYNLRTGERFEHNPNDYITRCTGASPSDVGAEIWENFLLSVFCSDADLIDYVQRVNGLAAIGKVFVEQIVISHGDGRNGKSSFWNPIIKAFGSYSGFISSKALTANCRHNVRPEIAELRGKRVVLARELQEGKRLDESILKKITSTDPIDGEKKYKTPFTFIPSHTPLMYTNFLPKIGSRDAGTKRRLCVVPFTAKFDGKSDIKNYGDYLFETAGGAIMKWIIEGAKKVIDSKFHIEPPECVLQATKDYIDAFDWLTNFLEARCMVNENEKAKSGELYNAYRYHCDEINEPYKRTAQDFNSALISAGFERIQPGGSKKPAYFQGLRLLTDAERDFDGNEDFLGTPPCNGAFATGCVGGR